MNLLKKDFGLKEYDWECEIKLDDTLPPLDNPEMSASILTVLDKLTYQKDLGIYKQAAMSLLFFYWLASRERKIGIRVTVDTQVPVSVGLGSSAAYNVSLATAIMKFFSIDIGENTQGEISQTGKQLINKWGFQAEKIMHGSPSGIDNSTSTFGGIVAFTGGKIESLEKVPLLQLVIVNTKVSRNTKLLVQKVATLNRDCPTISKGLLDSVHGVSQSVLNLFKEYPNTLTTDGRTFARIESHLETVIPINDYVLLALGVGHPALDKVREIASKYNFKSKLTGAGGGGSAFVLIPKISPLSQVNALIQDCEAQGFDCLRVNIGASGVRLHPNHSPLAKKKSKL